MARPDRVKSYSAASGFVYPYYFHEVQKLRRGPPENWRGTEYTYMVSADRKTVFPVCIFVRQDALEDWARQAGRALSGTEEYAVAKLRLFQAFDEIEDLAKTRPDLLVDQSNLESLLAALDI